MAEASHADDAAQARQDVAAAPARLRRFEGLMTRRAGAWILALHDAYGAENERTYAQALALFMADLRRAIAALEWAAEANKVRAQADPPAEPF